MYQSFRHYQGQGSDASFSPEVSLSLHTSGSSVASQFYVSPLTPQSYQKRSSSSLESDEGYCGTDQASLQQSIMGTFSTVTRKQLKTDPAEVLEPAVVISEDFLSANVTTDSQDDVTIKTIIPVQRTSAKSKSFPLDFSEIKVLRRKSIMLERHLPTSAETMVMCKEQGLLKNRDIKQILALSADSRRDALLSRILSSETLTHEKLCFLFERRGLDWVSDELKAELLWERGKLPVEDYIRQEALMLVAKAEAELGLSGAQRQKLIEAIAAKIQIYKEAGKKQAGRRRREMLNDMGMLNNDVSKITQDIEDFMNGRDLLRSYRENFNFGDSSENDGSDSDAYSDSSSDYSDSDSESDSYSDSDISRSSESEGSYESDRPSAHRSYHGNKNNSVRGYHGNEAIAMRPKKFPFNRTLSLPDIFHNQKVTDSNSVSFRENGRGYLGTHEEYQEEMMNPEAFHNGENFQKYNQLSYRENSVNRNGRNEVLVGNYSNETSRKDNRNEFTKDERNELMKNDRYELTKDERNETSRVNEESEFGIEKRNKTRHRRARKNRSNRKMRTEDHVSHRQDKENEDYERNEELNEEPNYQPVTMATSDGRLDDDYNERYEERHHHRERKSEPRRSQRSKKSKKRSNRRQEFVESGDVRDGSSDSKDKDSALVSIKDGNRKEFDENEQIERRDFLANDDKVEHVSDGHEVSRRKRRHRREKTRKSKSHQNEAEMTTEKTGKTNSDENEEVEMTIEKRHHRSKKKKHSKRKTKSSSKAERTKSEVKKLENEIMENAGTPKAMTKLTKNIKAMSHLMDTVLEDQDRMIKERNKCLEILGFDVDSLEDAISKNNGNSKDGKQSHDVTDQDLSSLLETSLRKVSQELTQKNDDVVIGKNAASSLEGQIKNLRSEMGRQISYKAVQVENQKRVLREKEDTIRKLERKMEALNINSSTHNSQVEYWKKRCELLEKTKRLGYYYLTWYDNVNPRKQGHPGALTYVSPESLTLRNGRVTLKDALAASHPPNDYSAPGGSGANYSNAPGGDALQDKHGVRSKEMPKFGGKSKEVTFRPPQTDRHGREITKLGIVNRSISTDYAAQSLITPDFPQSQGFVAIAGNPSSSFNAGLGKQKLGQIKSTTGSMPDIKSAVDKSEKPSFTRDSTAHHSDFSHFCKCCPKCSPN